MARSYLSSGQSIAQRENRVRNARRRKSYSSLNDQLLAETTAICTEKKLNSKRGKYAITHAAHYTLQYITPGGPFGWRCWRAPDDRTSPLSTFALNVELGLALLLCPNGTALYSIDAICTGWLWCVDRTPPTPIPTKNNAASNTAIAPSLRGGLSLRICLSKSSWSRRSIFEVPIFVPLRKFILKFPQPTYIRPRHDGLRPNPARLLDLSRRKTRGAIIELIIHL